LDGVTTRESIFFVLFVVYIGPLHQVVFYFI